MIELLLAGVLALGHFSYDKPPRPNEYVSSNALPNKINIYTTQADADYSYRPHYTRPERHYPLALQIILFALFFFAGIACLLYASIRSNRVKPDAIAGYIILGPPLMAFGVIGCIITIS